MTDLALQGTGQDSRRLPWLTLGLGLGMALVFALLGPAPEALLYDRAAIQGGQLWRLVTGHLVHGDALHLTWNLAAFLILGALAELRLGLRPVALLALLGVAALGIDAWLWWVEPGWLRYCGLSGVLNGLLAVVAVGLWRRTGSWLFLALLAGDVAKIAAEAWHGGALLPTSGALWVSVPGAHLAGLAAGLLIMVIPGFHRR